MQRYRSRAGLTFMLHTVLCQAIAAASMVIVWPIIQNFLAVLTLGTASAFLTAQVLRLPTPWKLLNTVLPLGLSISLAVELPNWIFLAGFIGLMCVYAPAFWTRVPYYPTPTAAYSLILAELPRDRPFTFVDIGCGFADLLLFLSKHRPNGRFIGLEIGVLPWLVARVRARCSGSGRVSIRCKDMWRESLADYDVVYTFLSPAPMARMWDKAVTEMRDGSLFITNTFPVPAEPSEVLEVRDPRCSKLFLHRMASIHKAQSTQQSA